MASGFLLRVLGGAAATHVKPLSIWFLLVCSLGALGVAVAKRYTELTSPGRRAVRHRPVMRWYRPEMLRIVQVLIGVGMLATYLMWALARPPPPARGTWRRALPLAAALVRFGVLTARRTRPPGGRPDHQGRAHALFRGGLAGAVLRRALRGLGGKR